MSLLPPLGFGPPLLRLPHPLRVLRHVLGPESTVDLEDMRHRISAAHRLRRLGGVGSHGPHGAGEGGRGEGSVRKFANKQQGSVTRWL